ncbi:MAG TPA: NTP transferase domain-containing protein [Candidatus Baltobacteraceae bacterium]
MRTPRDAVITAGGRVGGAFARAIGTDVKGLGRVRDATMLQRAIAAARGAGALRIAVVGGAEVREASDGTIDKLIPEHPSGAANVRAALASWAEDGPLLYLASDMPYVDADALRDFIDRVPEGVLAMPLAEESAYARRFPNAPPHGICLAGERVSNGGAFVIPAGARMRVDAFAARLFDARKSAWKMAALLGLPLLADFATRRLSIARLEAHALRVVGLPAIAIRAAAPELAFDCDTAADYEYACAHA